MSLVLPRVKEIITFLMAYKLYLSDKSGKKLPKKWAYSLNSTNMSRFSIPRAIIQLTKSLKSIQSNFPAPFANIKKIDILAGKRWFCPTFSSLMSKSFILVFNLTGNFDGILLKNLTKFSIASIKSHVPHINSIN